MTRSKRLVAEAYDELTATARALADLDEALSGMDLTGIRSAPQAKEFLQGLLEDQADERAMAAAEPQWEPVNYTQVVCKSSCCLGAAAWVREVVLGDFVFSVQACDKHAGKEGEGN